MSYICKYCGKEFETSKKLGGHISKCKLNPNNNQSKSHKSFKENFEKRNPLEEHKLICQVCGKEYILQIRHNQFEQGKYRKTCCSLCSHKLSNINCNLEEKNKKISKALQKEHYKICKYCGKIFNTNIRGNSDFCSEDCRLNSKSNKCSIIAKENNLGGYNENSIKKHHHGNYKGIHCDSSWELAYLVWCLEHNIKIERCKEIRYYKVNKQIRRYFPDFIVEGQIIEIKGYNDKGSQIKAEQNPDIKVLLYNDLKESLDYTINKYGNKFWEVLYDK